jgi:hypothetical protein
MMHRLVTVFLAASLAAAPAFAAEDTPPVPAPEATAAAAAPEDDDSFTIQTATCSDVFDLYEDASPGEGKDPDDLEKAQDAVLLFVVWVHGYLSGRDGINEEKRPLSKEGIETTVKDIAEACKPDESKRFLDVVHAIK